ncbi:hypothetical protein BDZ45DRAFT_811894 [Acephala macrosclerotiorum]|nr:hypothetical protein BDZ45DRAFT_811894 [Acephala macrosclerotiorum]
MSEELTNLSIPVIAELPAPEANVGNETTAQDPDTSAGTQLPSAALTPAILSSPEFAVLDPRLQKPLVEFGVNNLPMSCPLPHPGAQVLRFFPALMNSLSSGTVSISSSNLSDPPIINRNYGSHAYDRRIAIEGMKALLDFVKMGSALPLFHFGGTCRMRRGEKTSVVDRGFKVHDLKVLRVADNGIMPELINNHS